MRFLVLTTTLILYPGLAAAQSADACGVCHRTVYEEWLQSPHAQAWQSERFQEQLQAFGTTKFCGGCHAPETIWKQVDLRPELTESEKKKMTAPPEDLPFDPHLALLREAPVARSSVLEDGVTCSSCHFIQVFRSTSVAWDFLGPYHTTEGHEGKEHLSFRSLELCGACHGRPTRDYLPTDATNLQGYHHLQTKSFAFVFDNSDCAACHPSVPTMVRHFLA